ncbi:serine/arginine repetitive matrix protein 1 [Brachypodium distachyon]|uniref:DUF4408 domain-containing protein n=1 Tax=Brachypodium distachyon TaxID=15368 RepID=I1I660_BRADI|nr:serine/arginine repetitive matrix protein 1 [Brachypodium distachyon]KQJ97809.1 hypothetical protein BRADI_3g33420v3 [Brachypodium distachyon]|eukprot:XP_003572078.1 serine/arginine repetitive matrix protein 1 [Brachypodium distachyon]
MAVARAASVLGSFPFRAALVALCVLLLPLLPSPQGGGGGEDGGGGGQAFLAKVWELLHLLLVGIAVSYGLFGRRNDDGGVGEKDEGGAAPAMGKTTDARYVSRMLQGDLVFDDDDGDVGGARSWSALHHAEEPVVMVADGGGGRSGHVARQQQAPPLSLPVRALRPQQDSADFDDARPPRRSGAHDDTVLPSPIPWRSRTGRLGGDAPQPAPNTSSPAPSPKRLSPAPSMSKEAPAEEHEVPRRRSAYRSSQPPAPPPPPPPFLVHGYHPVAERRTTAAAAVKSFKEELQVHSTRGRRDYDDRYSQSSPRFSNSSSSSSANPRSSFDGPSSPSVGRSVRTIRPRQRIQTQTQTQVQELPNDDECGGDAPDSSRGSEEEPYGYRAYQSIPRFEYEKADPILGKVTVSSDETESSDDDEEDDEAYSTKATNSPSTAAVDENEVDKKAEEFIARFREQIRLQRIESIKKSAGPRAVKHGK